LIDSNIEIPHRSYKIWITILGADENCNRIWNGENIIKLYNFNLFLPYFTDEEWENFKTVVSLYRSHSYRESDIPNRHGYHATNPSYYGLGYSSVTEFLKRESLSEVKKYLGIWSEDKRFYREYLKDIE